MHDNQQSLWNRIQAFEIDDVDSAYPFSARLARENGWSRLHAERVIKEYKRFVFLCGTADHVACPSDQVDQAWHLHLTYTRSYWQELCQEVLGRPLHHGPTRGGAAEHRKHVDLYERTLQSYRLAFGEEPPASIWPPPGVRFGAEAQFRRVNTQRYWVLPKWRWPHLPARQAGAAVAGALLIPMFGALLNPFTMRGPQFLIFYGVLFVIAVALSVFFRNLFREPDDGEDEKLSPNSVACLAHTDKAPIMTTVCRLIQSDSLELVCVQTGLVLKQKSFRIKTKGPLPADTESKRRGSLALAIYEHADSPQGVELAKLLPHLRGNVDEIRANLEQRGLLESDASFAAARMMPRYLLGGLLVIGAIKLVIGLSGERPVGFLIGSLVVTGVVLAMLSVRPRRTRKGERILNRYRTEYADLRTLEAPEGLTPDQIAMAAGLFGLGAFSAGGFDLIHDAWQRSFGTHLTGGSGSGCSGGCGGGGGGCGGGGCGGGGCGGCGGGGD